MSADISTTQIEEARRVREQWPDWMRRNRDAVHLAVAAPLSATCDWVTHASMPKHARSHE